MTRADVMLGAAEGKQLEAIPRLGLLGFTDRQEDMKEEEKQQKGRRAKIIVDSCSSRSDETSLEKE